MKEQTMRAARTICRTIAAGVILLGTSSSALAVNIGGLNVPLGPTFAVAQIYENVVTGVGQTLAGYGKVDSINSMAVNTLCTDCELTYRFRDYTVSSISATEIKFIGGVLEFYLGFGANNDFTTGNAGGSAGDLVEATNGTLFLTLRGHAVDAAGNTFIGTGVNIGSLAPTGFGSGLADVDTSAGGIANAYFNTNLIPALFGSGNADFALGSSFNGLQPVYPGECPGGAACLRGSADATGNVQDAGSGPDVRAVPEPATVLLLGSAFVAAAVAARRKRS